MLKKIKILSLIAILLISSLFYGCEKTVKHTDSSNQSVKVVSQANPTWKLTSEPVDLFSRNMVGFFNEKCGISVGLGGEIHYTIDGGKTWDLSSNSSLCLFGLNIVNTKVAYASGNGSTVLKTMDGGKNWRGVSCFGQSEPNHPRYLSFVDENTGWIATANKFEYNSKTLFLGSTKDGGNTWDNIIVPEEIEEILAIYLRTPDNGYIIDNKNNLYLTKDGGKTFIKQPLNLKDLYPSAKFEQRVVLNFTDENNAFIAYMNKDYKIQAVRSSDGVKTWTSEAFPDLNNGALYLSQDGKFLTLTYTDGSTKILQYR